jgi:excinuclease UvrABC helicase subunit UvrB
MVKRRVSTVHRASAAVRYEVKLPECRDNRNLHVKIQLLSLWQTHFFSATPHEKK